MSAWTPLPSALEAILEPMRPTTLLATEVPNLPAILEPTVPRALPAPGIRPVMPPTSIAVPRPSFHFLPDGEVGDDLAGAGADRADHRAGDHEHGEA